MEATKGISEVFKLQSLLAQTNMMEIFDALSEAEWVEEDIKANGIQDSSDSGSCKSDLDSSVRYFCGTLRKKTNKYVKAILKEHCPEESYKQG